MELTVKKRKKEDIERVKECRLHKNLNLTLLNFRNRMLIVTNEEQYPTQIGIVEKNAKEYKIKK